MAPMDVAELVSPLDRTVHGTVRIPDRVNPCLAPMAFTPALSSSSVQRQSDYRIGI